MNSCTILPLSQAVDLSLKFVPESSVDIVVLVSDRLANIGRHVQVNIAVILLCGDAAVLILT